MTGSPEVSTFAPQPGTVQRTVQEGMAVEFSVTSLSGRTPAEGFVQGDDVRVTFKVSDAATGTPATTLEPAAWIHAANSTQACQDKVRAFLSANLAARADLDLTTFYVLALNDDASISVVDPLFSFGGSKLLDMILLKSPGEDWVLSHDNRQLYVTLPQAYQLAVINTSTWDVVEYIDTGPNPVRVELQEDGQYLWVGCNGENAGDMRSGVTIIDTSKLEKVTHIPTGAGHHEIAFGDNDHFAYVTNRRDGTLSVIDVWELQLEQQVTVGRSPISVAYSHLSGAVYVSNEEGGTVAVLDDTSHLVTATITAEPGIGALRFEPRGRLAFLVSRNEDVVHIIDSATNRLIQTVDVGPHPDQVTFTETLAYVRSRGSELVLMIPLDQIGREGDPVPIIDFSGGQLPFGDGMSVADGIVAAPGGVAALVANPADRVIYYYREGMAAPMGSFQNYGRRPRAVMAVDRSLQEVAPGVYSTDVNLASAGLFDVPFFMDTPRIIHCFSLEVAPDPGLEEGDLSQGLPLAVEPLFDTAAVPIGEPFPMRFLVTRPETGEPVPDLADLGVLAFNTRGWQRRTWATSIGDGVYQTTFNLPSSGTYFISIQCPSEGLRANDMRPLIVLAEDAAAATSKTETAE